jgi:hypothetical protein
MARIGRAAGLGAPLQWLACVSMVLLVAACGGAPTPGAAADVSAAEHRYDASPIETALPSSQDVARPLPAWNKEIARILKISDKTVKTHLHHIYVKLHQSGRYKAFLSNVAKLSSEYPGGFPGRPQ